MTITKLTLCHALCWVLNTNNLSCATNNLMRDVTIGILVLQIRKLKFRAGSLPDHQVTIGRSQDVNRLLPECSVNHCPREWRGGRDKSSVSWANGRTPEKSKWDP